MDCVGVSPVRYDQLLLLAERARAAVSPPVSFGRSAAAVLCDARTGVCRGERAVAAAAVAAVTVTCTRARALNGVSSVWPARRFRSNCRHAVVVGGAARRAERTLTETMYYYNIIYILLLNCTAGVVGPTVCVQEVYIFLGVVIIFCVHLWYIMQVLDDKTVF